MNAKKKADEDYSAKDKFEIAASKAFSVLFACVRGTGKMSFRRISISCKGPNDYMAAVTAYDAIGEQEVVCFGNGASVCDALGNVNGSMAGDKWRISKPWPPRA